MFELKPTRRLSWSFAITQDGAPVGMFDLKRVRAGGELVIADRAYHIRRKSVFSPYVLFDGERAVARAKRSTLLKPNYHVTAEDRQLEVVSRGFLMRTAQLVHGDVVLATFRRANFIRRDVRIEPGAATVPVELLVFAAAVLILFWRQQSRSSG